LWKYERNIGEYNTLDLVKDTKTKKYIFCIFIFEMPEKGHNVLFQPRHSPQTIAWYYFTVIATVNWTLELD
jgi:hypothetical protein